MMVNQILVDKDFWSEQKFLVMSKSQEKEHPRRVQVDDDNVDDVGDVND